MKNQVWKLAGLAMVFAGATTLVHAQGPGGAEGGQRRPKPEGGIAERGKRPPRQEMMKKFDKDGDGQLSEEERAEMRKALGDRKGPPAGERPSREEMMKKFDKDGDGQLSEEERAAMRAAMGDRKGAAKPAPESE